MKKYLGLLLMTCFISTANAYFCLPGYHYSPNYVFEVTCDYDRIKDFVNKKTYNLECYQGLIYYYYCVKD